MKTESRRMRASVSVLLILGVLMAAFSVPLANASSSERSLAFVPTVNDLRISQVYGGGGNTGATYTHDFIEIFNTGASTINLAGWSVQYASATGTSWQVTNLAGSIGPGQYFLIQEAQGSGGTTPLPTPDTIGTIAMSGTNGKVALANVTTALAGSCPLGATVMDFVGYGTANCFEGSGATPALTNTTAALRAGDGCTDTDNNAADFTTGAPTPRNTASPLNGCGADNPPTVVSTTPASGAVDVPVDALVSVTFSEPVTVTGTIDIACTSGTQTVTPTGGPTTFTLPHTDFTLGDGCGITILASQVTDQDGQATPLAADYTWGFEVTNGCFGASTPIHDIQGSGLVSPLVGQLHSVEALVIADFQGVGNINGFFIQEPDGEQDADPATSEGLFVYDPTNLTPVAVNDYVRVSGTVAEFQNQTQLSSLSTVTICDNDPVVATPTAVTLPFPDTAYPERFEGMSVVMTQTLTVNETFNLGRGNILTLANGRLQQPTNVVLPGAPAGALQAANNLNQITLDDGSLVQNPDPIVYPPPGLTALNTVRSGDSVSNIAGVFTQGNPGWTTPGNIYRINPFSMPAFTATNPRPVAPNPVRAVGTLKVSSSNVLNYFLTLDTTNTPPFPCGPSANQECRGANTAFEFTRQRDKLLQALYILNADVVGLMELENTPNVEPLADLVNGLNALAGAGTYDYIATGTIIPGDVIKVGLIYKPGVVQPVGDYAILNSLVDPTFSSGNRPALAQTFEEIATHGRFTVIVNHLKSKGCTGATGLDTDQGDGQSCYNYTRTLAANALVTWALSDPTGSGDPDFMILGDLNAYAKEDPMAALETGGGYTDLETLFVGPNAYSYVFSAQAGSLDHSMANAPLTPQISGATTWHINADEPTVLDYNTEFKSAGQIVSLFNADAYRISDHDPLLIGLNLTPSVADLWVSKIGNPDPVYLGDTLVYTITTQNNSTTTVASQVVITDVLPSGVSFNGAAAYTGTCTQSGGTVECDMGNIGPGAIETVVISVTVDSVQCPSVLTNQVEVASNVFDPNSQNNTFSLQTDVECIPPNIFVDPLDLSSTQAPNTTTQQTLTISNTGGLNLTWNIGELPPTALPPAAPLSAGSAPTMVDPALAQVSEETGLLATREPSGASCSFDAGYGLYLCAQDAPAIPVQRDPAAHAQALRRLTSTGLLLVPDSTNKRVMAFDPITGNLVDANFIPADPTHLSTPINAILSAGDNSVLVSDQVNDVVQEYDLNGAYLGVFAPAGGANNAILNNIRGIALDASGNLLVTTADATNVDAVAKFDTNGVYLGNFIASGAGSLNSPFDIYGRTADWLVASIDTDNVLRFDLAGAPLGVFGGVNNFPEQVNGVANGNVLVANFGGTQQGIVEFTAAGGLISVYTVPTLGGYRGVYALPNGNILTTTGTGVHEINRSGVLVQSKITGVSGRFVEYVVIGDCANQGDIPWASTSPISGTTPAGAAQDVTVTFDSTGLAAGTYTGDLCIFSNDPDPGPANETELVLVPLTLTVTATPPNINVNPLSLSSTQATNTTQQQPLNVGNTGGSALTWSIFEDISGSPDMVDWSDNFDSYATGSQLHGQGGWKGWSNTPGAGALTSSAQARSAPNSAAIVGASDLVHEYSGYTSGPWVYTAWQFAPTDMTGVSYFILLNTYNDAGSGLNWSTQVQFDPSQNLVINDGASGGTLPLVKGQWVELRVEIDLNANTQAFYYNNQLLYLGTWTDEQTPGGGALNIGAVDLYANNASTVYYDDLSLAAPVQPVACDAPADIPWASVNPTNGTTSGGGSTPVTVTFDSTGLANGTYTGNLCVTSNDPDPGPGNGTNLVIVPLTLTVQPPTAVTLGGLTANTSQSPVPANMPLAVLPVAAGLAMAAVYALRRKR